MKTDFEIVHKYLYKHFLWIKTNDKINRINKTEVEKGYHPTATESIVSGEINEL